MAAKPADSAAPVGAGSRGLVLGKFMPPHRGHQLLVDFARGYCDRVTVLVCSIQREPIPGVLRYGWMREIFAGDPRVELVHVTDEVPQSPEEHPDFWPIWRELIRRHAPGAIDLVFASEDYGKKLAQVLGARFVPLDPRREMVSISGTAVRGDVMRHWAMLPEPVRPYYVKRVCLFGPESTGKSTLARRLAEHFDTVHALEYARPLLDPAGGMCTEDDLPRIVRGQVALEEALARQANRVLLCDTDPLLTTVWSEVLFGRCDPGLRELALRRQYDLYLLMDTDSPWVDDGQRFLGSPEQRRGFFERCEAVLREHGRPYVVIRGDWRQRFDAARSEVAALLGEA